MDTASTRQSGSPVNPAWRHFVGLHAGSGRIVMLTSVLSMAQAALALPIALLLKNIFDAAATRPDLADIAVAALLLPVLYLLGDAMLMAANHFNLRATKAAVWRLRDQVAGAIYQRSWLHAREGEIGSLHSALVHDTERVDVMDNSLLSRVLPCSLSAAVLLCVLAALSWRLFAMAILILPLTWAIARLLHRPLQGRISRFHDIFEAFSANVLMALKRRDLARIQVAEPDEQVHLSRRAGALADAGYQYAWLATAAGLLQGEAMMLSAMLILVAGSILMAAGEIEIGRLIAFYFALGMLRANLSVLFAQAPLLVSGNAALQHLFGLLQRPTIAPYAGTRRIEFRGEVALEGVGFAYRDERVVHAADMLIKPARITALRGPSGAGKTTIAHLILGLARPDAGRLLADGIAYDELEMAALRARIGFVGQDPDLFPGTVRDNLVFGTPETDAGLHEALEIAGAGFVREWPAGLDTWLSESGAPLSGGQRQRLSIARAVLRRPALLILDEPTNHLGTAATQAILGRIRSRLPQTAIVIISHETDILNAADCQFALDAGNLRIEIPAPTP